MATAAVLFYAAWRTAAEPASRSVEIRWPDQFRAEADSAKALSDGSRCG